LADLPAPHNPPEDGQAPLDPDEARGLKLAWVATRADLNDAEGENILQGMRWGRSHIRKQDVVVHSESFLRQLHERMFHQVWEWAGRFRQTERNIGVAPYQIAVQLRQLFDNVEAWREFGAFSLDEQAVRLHHQLTFIHPFPNGNGRCSRVMADMFLLKHGGTQFTWGPAPHGKDVRQRYLAAIRYADAGDIDPLLNFVRS
jgi:Fic-DOC domain mobile mystery protein B